MKRFLRNWLGARTAVRCSFCGKYHNEVAKLIEGTECFICNECVKVCADLLEDEWGEDLASINEKALAKHREGIVGELSWLKEQHEAGHVSESVYLERQQDLLRPHRWGDKVRDKRENG